MAWPREAPATPAKSGDSTLRVRNKRGEPIGFQAIGLGQHNTAIRGKLSEAFQQYLVGKSDWFKQLTDFRDALAHRVPLFIPPYIISHESMEAYNALETEMNEAAINGDFETYNAKSIEQEALGKFQPIMLHSTVETEAFIAVHPQLLDDFAAVEEIGKKMLEELKR